MSGAPSAMLVYGIFLGRPEYDDVRFSKMPERDEDGEAYDELGFASEVEKADGARAVVYGSFEVPGFILGFEVQSSGDWGAVPLAPLVVEPEWDAKILELAEALGVDIGGKVAKWHLASLYV